MLRLEGFVLGGDPIGANVLSGVWGFAGKARSCDTMEWGRGGISICHGGETRGQPRHPHYQWPKMQLSTRLGF